MPPKKDFSELASFGIKIKSQTINETDSLRGDIPRSRWIERALLMYNGYVRKNKEVGTFLQSASSSIETRGERPAREVESSSSFDTNNPWEVAESVKG
jgi:hypothetical protein